MDFLDDTALSGHSSAPMDPGCALNSIPWHWFSRLLLWVLSLIEGHSNSRFLGCLSLNTPPVRVPKEMREPSSGKSSSRHQQTTAHYSWLPQTFHFCTISSGTPRTGFWESHLFVSLQTGKTALNSYLQKICRIFFSCHLEAGFIFQAEVFKSRNPELKQILWLYFWILKSTDEKGKGKNLLLLQNTFRQHHQELLVIKIPSYFWWESQKRF